MTSEEFKAKAALTKEGFIERYCSLNGLEWAELSRHKVALPCACDYEKCEGWAMVPNDPLDIETHNTFYAPEAGT